MRIGIGWADGPLKVFDVAANEHDRQSEPCALGGFACPCSSSSSSLLVTKFGKGFVANIAVLLGIVVGAIGAALSAR